MKIAVLDVWRYDDLAEFRTVLPALRARGVDVIDLYVEPEAFATSQQWIDAMLTRLEEEAAGESINLLGFCAGGRVALSLAEELERRGTSIQFLGLIETWQRSPLVELDRALYSRYGVSTKLMIRQQLQWLTSSPGANWRDLVRCYARNWKSIIGRSSLQRRAREKSGSPSEWLIMHFTHASAIPIVSTPVQLFNSRESIREYFGDPSMALAPYFRGGFRVHLLEGDHHSCTQEPHQSSLVDQIISTVEALTARS